MAPATLSPTGSIGFIVVDAGAPLHLARTKVMVPTSFLGACYKPGRLVVVAATPAAPATGGGDDDGKRLPSGEEVAFKFGEEMKAFQNSYRPVTLLASKSEMTVEAAYTTALDCTPILEFLLSKETVDPNTYKELVEVGKALLTVEQQGANMYMRADALINAIQGVKLVANVFFVDDDLDITVPLVPSDEQDIDKESFFSGLVKLFIQHRLGVYLEARNKYSYGSREAYDDPPSAECKRALSDFRTEMDAFKASRSQAAVTGDSRLHLEACGTANLSLTMLELLLAQSTAHRDTRIPEELIAAGKALLIIGGQTQNHHLVLDDLVKGIEALKTIVMVVSQ